MKITFETPNGSRIDIVDTVEEVVSPFYIFKKDCMACSNRIEELGADHVTKKVAQLLIREGFLHRNDRINSSPPA